MKSVWLIAALVPVLGLAEPARPDVLLIVVDDLRTSLGCYGDGVAITPAIDTLAARGTRFTAAYCQQAVCNPSRASLLTGRRPDSLRVWDLVTPFRRTMPDIVTLPQYFRQHGYRAVAVGKIFHDGTAMADPASWSEEAQLDAVPKREDYRDPVNRREGGGKAAPFEFVAAPASAYPDGRVAEAAIQALAGFTRSKNRPPFFLALGFRKPHLPFTAPKQYWDLYAGRGIPPPTPNRPPTGAPAVALHDSTELRGYSDLPRLGDFSAVQTADLRRAYYAATSFADAQIGRVLEALRAEGLERDTLIVLVSDHGYHLGEQGLWVKTTNYEADTRVPLIVVLPGGRAGASTGALSELLDIYPTLVDLCGLPPAPGLEGRSLRPWLENPEAPGRRSVQSQFPRPWPSKREPRIMGYTVRTETHRYVEWRDWATGAVRERELYALAQPGDFERENIVADPAEAGRVRELAALLPVAGPHEPSSAASRDAR